jgi:hypothetical protein
MGVETPKAENAGGRNLVSQRAGQQCGCDICAANFSLNYRMVEPSGIEPLTSTMPL